MKQNKKTKIPNRNNLIYLGTKMSNNQNIIKIIKTAKIKMINKI